MEYDEPIRGEVRVQGFRRVSHGLFLVERPELGAEEEFERELHAWRLVLPPGAVFTHVTAARLLGWRLPRLPDHVPVFAAVHGGDKRPRRPGLICSRLVARIPQDEAPLRPLGVAVDHPEEVLLRAARDLGHLDLVIMIDSALALGHLDGVRLGAVLQSRRPGTCALRAALAVANPRPESAGETLLRRFHDVLGIRVEPQVDLIDESGAAFGRADLLVVGTRWVHEYDGAGHRKPAQHRADLRRDRRLAAASYTRRGFTLDDLVNRPLVTMHELDRALNRAHRMRVFERWKRMVDGSGYSDAGRSRLHNRWRRAMGVVDWS